MYPNVLVFAIIHTKLLQWSILSYPVPPEPTSELGVPMKLLAMLWTPGEHQTALSRPPSSRCCKQGTRSLTLTVILGYSSCYSFHGPHIVHLKEEFRLCVSSSSAHNKMLQEVFTLHPLHTAVATSSPSTVPSALLWVSDQSATMPWRLTPT